jgi:hypothetical protein
MTQSISVLRGAAIMRCCRSSANIPIFKQTDS